MVSVPLHFSNASLLVKMSSSVKNYVFVSLSVLLLCLVGFGIESKDRELTSNDISKVKFTSLHASYSSSEECETGGEGSSEASIGCYSSSTSTECREGYYACCNCEYSTGKAKCSCKPSEGEDEEHTASLPMLGTTKPRLVSDASRFGEDFGSRVLSSPPCSSKPPPHATLVKQFR